MDTVEIVVYLFVAVIIGSLVLYATYELTNQDIVDNLQGQLEDELGFAVVNESLSEYLFAAWNECNFGANEMNFTFQYIGEDVSKQELFSEVRRLNLCRSLSSETNNCGEREDLIVGFDSGNIEKGILVAQCAREDGVGGAKVCKAAGCEEPPQPPINAICGENNAGYTANQNSWVSDEFCERGVLDATEPAFPQAGEAVTWTCLGENGGDNASCVALRDPADASCGDNSQSYGVSDTSWPGSEFCERGTLQEEAPEFPASGETVTWVCEMPGAQDVTCSANKAADEVSFSCAGREPPSSLERALDFCRAPFATNNEIWNQFNDCTQYKNIFGSGIREFPGTTSIVRAFTHAPDEYLALEFRINGPLDADARGQINTAGVQNLVGHFGPQIGPGAGPALYSFSTCPGDFNQEAIESDPNLGPGCIGHVGGIGTMARHGGSDFYNDPQRCALKSGVDYYLNIMFTEQLPGTPTQDLQPSGYCYEGPIISEPQPGVEYWCGKELTWFFRLSKYVKLCPDTLFQKFRPNFYKPILVQ